MESSTTRAICLKSREHKESDRVLSLLSPTQGRLEVLAKGARKAKSTLAGACEALSLMDVHLSPGRVWHILTQYQSVTSFSGLRSDLSKLSAATLCTDLVYHLAPHEDSANRLIFEALLETLTHFSDAPRDVQLSPRLLYGLAVFEQTLLRATGYAPQLEHCVHCEDELDWERLYYPFAVAQGGVVCPRCLDIMPPGTETVNVATATLRFLSQPTAAAAHDVSDETLLKGQRFLKYYFSHTLEKPIHAFDLLFHSLEGIPG